MVGQHVYILRDIGTSVGLAPLRQIARQAGVKAVYRVTVCYADNHASNAVATLRQVNLQAPTLEVVYQGRFQHKPFVYSINEQRFERLRAAFQRADFDHLRDQPDVSFYGLDWWLVERAAGEFLRSVVLSPHKPGLPYSILVNAIDAFLPEILRQIP